MSTEELRGALATLVAANAVVEERIAAVLELARLVEDREGAGVVLEAAEVVGRCEQARHGQLIQLLGHAFEGRRPALFDNLLQVFNAPLFLTVEVMEYLGVRKMEQVSSRKDVRQAAKIG